MAAARPSRALRYRFCPPQYSMEAILSAAEMQAADARAIEAGLPGVCLMENAGRWVAEAAAQMVGPEARIGILCGTGNNGGDGFVAARHLLSWGYSPQIILCGDAERLRGDALVNAQAWGGGHVLFEAELAPYDLVVDALLGTGLRGEVRGGALEALRWLKAQRILAVDVPSGLCADTGRLLGPVVAAERTVTFAASKPGHWLHPGSALCGELWICDIGMQRSVLVEAARSDSWCILGDDALALALHPRPATTHKGSAGHLYIYGGSPGRTGAVRMSADAALRAGAGLVSIGTSAEAAASLSGGLYEVMCEVAQDLTSGRRDALVVGPGMSTEAGAGDWLAEQLPRIEAPVLVDADALNHLASRPEGWDGVCGSSRHTLARPAACWAAAPPRSRRTAWAARGGSPSSRAASASSKAPTPSSAMASGQASARTGTPEWPPLEWATPWPGSSAPCSPEGCPRGRPPPRGWCGTPGRGTMWPWRSPTTA